MEKVIIKAIVANLEDPKMAGRIQCKFPQLDGQVLPEWIEPIEMAGWLWLPEIDETVEVSIPNSDDWIEFPQEMNWNGLAREEQQSHPEEFKTNYPKRRGFRTKTGMLLIIDETPGEEKFSWSHRSNTLISITNNGIFFGSEIATEPMVLGIQFKTLMTDILDAIILHTHPTGVGPSGPPLNAATFSAQKTTVVNQDQLSDFIKAQKVAPT